MDRVNSLIAICKSDFILNVTETSKDKCFGLKEAYSILLSVEWSDVVNVLERDKRRRSAEFVFLSYKIVICMRYSWFHMQTVNLNAIIYIICKFKTQKD